MTRPHHRDHDGGKGSTGNGLGAPRSTDHELAYRRGLVRSEQVLRVRALYKARRPQSRHPAGWVDDDLNAECWAIVLGEGN